MNNLERTLDDLQLLGFRISKSDILNDEVDYKDVRIAYINDKGNVIYRKLGKLTPRDIFNAYNCIKDDNEDIDAVKLAYANINSIYMDKKVADDVNKNIVNHMAERINNIDANENTSNENDEKDDENNIDNTINEDEKVVKVENDNEKANEAKAIINTKTVTYIAIAALLTAATLYGVHDYLSMKEKADKKYEELDNDFDENEIVIDNNNNDVIVDNAMNPISTTQVVVPTTEVNESTTLVVEQNNQTTVNVHSDEYINNVADKIYNSILSSGNSYLASVYNRDLVESLVRYTHHNYAEYSGYNTLTNEIAYEKFFELIQNKVDISMFYEGLNNYQDLKNLNDSLINVKEEKGSYSDEFNAYGNIETVLNNLNRQYFPEAVALRAYIDIYSVVPSMQMARGGALENNEEGIGYYNEKASVNVSSAADCKRVYNRVETDNPNSELSQIVFKALDEDDSKAYIR